MGGSSRCAGRLEMEHLGEWRPVVIDYYWNLKSSLAVCRQLECGSAVFIHRIFRSTDQPVWIITAEYCAGSESSLRECGMKASSPGRLEVICSGNKDLQ